jgi:heptosyltransferase III
MSQPHVPDRPVAPLALRFGALGDMVMAIPLLRALAERHGQPCDIIARGPWLPDLYRHLPFVGELHSLNSRNLPYFLDPRKRAVVRWLRDRRPGPIYLLQDDAITMSLIHRSGVAITAWNRSVSRPPNEHTIDRHRRLAGFGDEYRRDPELRVSAAEAEECRQWLATLGIEQAPLVLIQAGNRKTRSWRRSATDRKIWPETHWVQVAREVLASRADARVLFIGAPKEQPLAQRLTSQLGDPRVLAVADQLPLRRLFALLRVAHSLISVDTGPAHAAAALGCPAVVLFGTTDPRITGPYAGASQVLAVVPPGAPQPSEQAPWPAGMSLSAIPPAAVATAWSQLTTLRTLAPVV